MKRILSLLLIPILAFALSGCYHAKVSTGKRPSGQTVEKAWATSFINGLVPPSTVEVAQQCPNGVAMVETKLSFLNQIVGGFTGGLYSPMHITVTCAASGSASVVAPPADFTIPTDVTEVEATETIQSAAIQSAQTSEPVRVVVDR